MICAHTWVVSLREDGRDSTRFYMLDLEDAFWQIPMMHSEQTSFTTYLGGRYYVLKGAAQSSRVGPLLGARLIALVTRLTQGAVRSDGRLSCYVDDPLVVLHGNAQQRLRLVSIIFLCWLRALGFGLALRKGRYDHEVTWTSGQLSISYARKTTRLKDELVHACGDHEQDF